MFTGCCLNRFLWRDRPSQIEITGLTLRQGENTLVLKVCHERGPWAVGLRFKDADDRPVTDFRIATSPAKESRRN
jgi:hypothetical protein